MRRWVLLAVLAAVSSAQEDQEAAPPPRPRPTLLARGERDAPAVFLRLREGGVLRLKSGDSWCDATLDECAAFLHESAKKYDALMRKRGGSGYDALPGGGKASRLFVPIDAEPTVPWQHVQWLMALAADCKFPNVELSDGTRKILALLPVDPGPAPKPAPAMEIFVSTHLIARREQMAQWGNLTVARPTEIRYRSGDRETGDVAAAGRWIREAKKAAGGVKGSTVVGEVKAGRKVQAGRVLEVLDFYLDNKIAVMHFSATPNPSPEQRKMARLPYPLRNY